MQSARAGYKAEGGFVYRNFVSASEEHFRFEAQVGQNGWLIRTRRDGVFRHFGHHEVGGDGTNVFRVLSLNSEPCATARARTNSAFVNGWVTPGTVPEPDAAHARFVWFALVAVPSGQWSNSVPCGLLYDVHTPICTVPCEGFGTGRIGKGRQTDAGSQSGPHGSYRWRVTPAGAPIR